MYGNEAKDLETMKQRLYKAFNKAVESAESRIGCSGSAGQEAAKKLEAASRAADSIIRIETEQREAALQAKRKPTMKKDL